MLEEHNALLRELGKDTRLIVRSVAPLNVETPTDLLLDPLTPLHLFFIRNNDTVASLTADEWSLRITGLVERPLTVDLQRLRSMPAVRHVALLQCSGNGRSRFAQAGQPAEGVAWENGAVGNAEWEGVPVRALLEEAGVRPEALQAECVGGDDDRTTRGVEVAKLLDDAILAFAMNGQPLPRVHGGPVRLVVPGWGGINWIKWIVEMRLIAGESPSRYNQEKYVVIDAGGVVVGKVREFGVNSLLTHVEPAGDDGTSTVAGFAWSPYGIARVEVSAGGGPWQPARLLNDLGPRAWRAWQWSFPGGPGEHLLAVRATDCRGEQQPEQVAWNRHGYLMNAIQLVRVRVA